MKIMKNKIELDNYFNFLGMFSFFDYDRYLLQENHDKMSIYKVNTIERTIIR